MLSQVIHANKAVTPNVFWTSIEVGWSRVIASAASDAHLLSARIAATPNLDAATAATASTVPPPLYHLPAMRWALVNHATPADERARAASILEGHMSSLSSELSNMLQKLPRHRVEEWEAHFGEALHHLDAPRYRRSLGGRASHSWFLHTRSFIVAVGRNFYRTFRSAPLKYSPGSVSCEELLYVTHDILNPHPDDDWDESKEAEAGAEDDGETDSTTDDK